MTNVTLLLGRAHLNLEAEHKAEAIEELNRLGYAYDEFGRHPLTGQPVGLTEAPVLLEETTGRLYAYGNYQLADWFDRAAAGIHAQWTELEGDDHD